VEDNISEIPKEPKFASTVLNLLSDRIKIACNLQAIYAYTIMEGALKGCRGSEQNKSADF
jgi:hypothetical protein